MNNLALYGRDIHGQPLTRKQKKLFDALDRREQRQQEMERKRQRRIQDLTREIQKKKCLPHIGLPVQMKKPLPVRPVRTKELDPGPAWRIWDCDRREKRAIARKIQKKHKIKTYSITPVTRRLICNVKYILWNRRLAENWKQRRAQTNPAVHDKKTMNQTRIHRVSEYP